jgi:hypothetical protein
VPSLPRNPRAGRTAQRRSAIGSPADFATGHLMTGRALAISIPTTRRRRAVPPEVCLRSPFTDAHRLSPFRHRSILSPNPSPTVSIPPSGSARNPQTHIQNTAAFRTRLRSSSVIETPSAISNTARPNLSSPREFRSTLMTCGQRGQNSGLGISRPFNADPSGRSVIRPRFSACRFPYTPRSAPARGGPCAT